MAALKQVNEEARQTRLMALDERAKVSVQEVFVRAAVIYGVM